MKEKSGKLGIKELRQNALAVMKSRSSRLISDLTEIETLKLIHELEVHQIELEMQNEELINARAAEDEASQKYIDLYDFAPNGYLSLSKAGEITKINLTGALLLDRTRDKLIKSSFGFFLCKESILAYNQFLAKLSNQSSQEFCELKLKNEGGTFKSILLTGIQSQDGEEYNLSMVDITELKETQNQLIKAKDKAEESDRLKSAFLANMSHEIRTPMNGIIGFAALLKAADLPNEKRFRYVDILEKSSARMLSLINNIITISRIQSKQIVISISEVNLYDQIQEIYNFFKHEVENKGISLSIGNSIDNKDFCLKTDQEKVYSIFTNLVKNAIKFTDEGHIEIGYRLISKDSVKKSASENTLINAECKEIKPIAGAAVEFYVSDTGKGIQAGKKDLIFDRFRQENETITKDYGGSGLGLAISKSYVELLGGEIRLESELDKGSTFYFTIPI